MHSGAHHRPTSSGAWSVLGDIGVLLLELDSFDVLGILDFFLDVLVSLQQLVVFSLSQLQTLVQVGLQFFLQGVHLVLLLLDQFGLGSDDLLVALLHVLLPLSDFKFLGLLLYLMGFGVLLLLGQASLDFLKVQEL